MAGNTFWKERAAVTLESSGGSLSNSNSVAATTALDVRSGGNAAQDFYAAFELLAQWSTITNITAGVTVAQLYLVPALDGTNYMDVDTTTTTGISPAFLSGLFIAHKQLVTATNYRFGVMNVPLLPLLYKAYVLNTSGQTMSSGWTLKVVSAQEQYT